MLHEISFQSFNQRDQVQGWIYVPAAKPVGIIQLVHGFGEHSRRYLHMISKFLDAGFIVAADDHVGHGRTAVVNNSWGDWGDKGPHTMMEGDVWSLPDGLPLPLSHFVPSRCRKHHIISEISNQIQARLATGESLFYEDWLHRLHAHFSPRHFFLSSAGPVLFYPTKTISPAIEGFPSFSLSSLSTWKDKEERSEEENQKER